MSGESQPIGSYNGPLYTPDVGAPTTGGINPANLTPEGLLFYCQNQLGSIDADIKEFMANQKAMLQKKEILAKVKNEISTHNPPTGAEVKQIAADLKAAYDELAEAFPGDPALEALGAAAATMVDKWAQNTDATFGSIEPVPPGSTAEAKVAALVDAAEKWPDAYTSTAPKTFWEGVADDLGQTIEDIKGNAELQMIQLQSLISARQTAVQLTTNMLSKVDQTLQSVVSNIK